MLSQFVRAFFFSLLFCYGLQAQESIDILLEGSVECIQKKWDRGPMTGLPFRKVSKVCIKLDSVVPLKRTKLENDVTIIDENTTFHGKGYRLDPIPTAEISPELLTITQRLKNEKEAVEFPWWSSIAAKEFLVKSRRLLNSLKETRIRAVYTIYPSGENASAKDERMRPVEMHHGGTVHKDLAYRELWSQEAKKTDENVEKQQTEASVDYSSLNY
ncbi:hypothetical protein HOF92_17185 [bacterium]|jgi:hypothetical protein|nr:hypothetical protein [bacterium]